MTAPHIPDRELKYRADQAREPATGHGGIGGRYADEGRGYTPVVGRQRLGELSRPYESAAGGPGAVSSGKGDKGGVSYGSWQLATNEGQPQAFLKSPEGRRWASEFGNSWAGTPAFSDRWQAIAAREPAAFESAQYEFIKRTHYDVLAEHIKSSTSLDVDSHSQTLRDVVWSTAVQHGPNRGIVSKAVKAVAGRNGESVYSYDDRLISRIYIERGRQFPATISRFKREAAAAGRKLDAEFRR